MIVEFGFLNLFVMVITGDMLQFKYILYLNVIAIGTTANVTIIMIGSWGRKILR